MNPIVTFALSRSFQKYLWFVLAALSVIVALPLIAVFSLGTSALTFLSESSSSETAYALSSNVQGFYQGPEIKGDTYAWGNCTYWAYALRLQDGHPIPASWGNANTWDDRARNDGYIVDHTPTVGAVYQTDAGFYGHVAYVSGVDELTGNWTISEMNAPHFNVVSSRTFKPYAANLSNFIHYRN